MKVIALDIGGTSIKSGVVLSNKLIFSEKTPTETTAGLNGVLKSIFIAIDKCLNFDKTVVNIGIASAGDIDPFKGEVVYATDNLPGFSGCKILSILENRYPNKKFKIINDATSAVIAESIYGVGKNFKNIVMLTLGTGVGGGVIIDGNVLLGHSCQGSRLGHTTLESDGRQCNCGRKGCVEQYISATGFLKTAKDFGIDLKEANQVFKVDDKLTLNLIIDKFTDQLAVTILNFNAIFNPEIFILGGGLVFTAEHWWDNLSAKLPKTLRLAKAELKNDAGMLGAYFLTKIKYSNSIKIK